MKKITFLFIVSFVSSVAVAQSWCGNSFIVINDLWYTGSNSYVHTGGYFNGGNLGTFASGGSLSIGGELQVWPELQTAATMYYKIDDAAAFTAVELPKTGTEGNNSKHFGTASVSLSTLATGNHTIAVYFQAGDVYDSNSNNNYVAAFSVSVTTGLDQSRTDPVISAENSEILLAFSGKAIIRIYNAAGQLLTKSVAENTFRYPAKSGLYIVRINDLTRKLTVR
jgi:hypothetical protein